MEKNRITVTRYHDISCGHRVAGHEGKCQHLHGHNYRIHFTCSAELDSAASGPSLDMLGRVIDFSEIKSRLCQWLEDRWDHKFLAWVKDPVMRGLEDSVMIHSRLGRGGEHCSTILENSLVWVPFNPTAENMAVYLKDVIAPQVMEGTGIMVTRVVIEETRKCSATYGEGA